MKLEYNGRTIEAPACPKCGKADRMSVRQIGGYDFYCSRCFRPLTRDEVGVEE